ncbi:MAG: CcmD family protein [Cyclobacteriaceae bacterium]|nr:MAG: CcmD family protein [Cyclobacteriaceae bacterium]
MKSIVRYAIGVVLFFLSTTVSLNAQPVEMADTMRSEGKIYVVVGIVLIVLAGLIIYLFMLDRRVKKLENGQK